MVPQLELSGHVGGAKQMFQRSGIVARMITMVSAMSAAWATSSTLRGLFFDSYPLFLAAAFGALAAWMVVDYVLILPSEQRFSQEQSQRKERSPLKRDHEELKRSLEELK
jgi:hypothetical protein